MTHLRQVMLEELQRRNFAPTTISTYLHVVEQFARHFKCRPDRLNQTHFRWYQAYLLRERKVLGLLRSLTPAQWQRGGLAPGVGTMTIERFVVGSAAHDDNHLEQVRRALDGRA